MTTTQAINAARREVTMHRQGNGWYVSSPYCDSLWTSNEMPYAVSREQVRRLRIERALDLLGCDDDYVVHYALESGDRFETAVRDAVRDRQ